VTVSRDIYGGQDPRSLGTYTIPMAAGYVRVNPQTLRNWVNGYTYKTSSGQKRSQPHVIEVATRGNRVFLSFTNLVEAHVLACIRRIHELPLQTVRRSLKFIGENLGVAHPLAHERFATDGIDLFVERFDGLINVSAPHRQEMKTDLRAGVERIVYVEGSAGRLFPFSRPRDVVELVEQPRVIVIDPRLSFGRPVVEGSGVPIAEISGRFKAGESVVDLAKEFRLQVNRVEEALRAAA
jgi:uncharacterized protein (DUF433 family)